ncbi:putative membrane protein [Methanofollis sp. W23]|uniref:small multi-drug export protein n=1 Tax=Methanofollis sp. W23 TaxID=2817849 RepID=UPI001AE4E88D|nr:small multi-drug export protein [Methanofollis sp. W23]MBP2146890.1 putative membrane protein [Methanofollis sp. W23]
MGEGGQRNIPIDLQGRAGRLILPLLLYPLYALALYVLFPDEATLYIGLMAAYIAPPVGREALIPMAVVLGQPWWLTALTCTYVDVVGCLIVALNFDLVLALPRVGPKLASVVRTGEALLERRPWLRGLSYAGIVLFTTLPMMGSGGIGGAVVGRLMGLDERGLICCVGLGAAIGATLLALGATFAVSLAGGGVIVGIALLLVFVTVGYLLRRVALLDKGPTPTYKER